MANPAKVTVKIISVKGKCVAKHCEGQEFDLSKDFTLGVSGNAHTLCPSAFYAIFHKWWVLRHGGELPWEEDRDQAHVVCPDPFNPVLMELRRVKE